MSMAPVLERVPSGGALLDKAPLRTVDSAAVWPIRIERVDVAAASALAAAWRDLLDRAREPNVFLDPAFALPLLHTVEHDRLDVLLAWAGGQLVGLLPIRPPAARWMPGLARGFRSRQATLGTPLLDAGRGDDVFDAMLTWLGGHYPGLSGLLLTAIPTEGPFCMALRARAGQTGRSIVFLDAHRRAILRHDAASSTPAAKALSAKRRKELRRQRRRLWDSGALTYHQASEPADVARAVEQFLALEASGWKGRRKTALLMAPALAAFTRSMTGAMAAVGRCRIDSLAVAGEPVAMGILVTAGSHAHFWKTTFDERFAARSPGVQFALELTHLQKADATVTLTDSCAVPDHPMIDRLWTDRMGVADLAIALRTGAVDAGGFRSGGFAMVVRAETARRRLRHIAKTLAKSALRLVGARGSH